MFNHSFKLTMPNAARDPCQTRSSIPTLAFASIIRGRAFASGTQVECPIKPTFSSPFKLTKAVVFDSLIRAKVGPSEPVI